MHYLNLKKLDVDETNVGVSCVIHSAFADKIGLKDGDLVDIYFSQMELGAVVTLTDTMVNPNEIGLFEDVWMKYKLPGNALITLEVQGQANSINYIRSKILGQPLEFDQIKEIMYDIAHHRLNPIEMTYFAAASYSPGFNQEEVYFLTKAMAETGKMLKFKSKDGKVIDKHSIGGLPSKGVTPILVSLLASLGYVLPNTSSRAITSPAGTSDVLETLMPISLTEEKIVEVVNSSGACLVWGGGLELAPADDVLIQIERPLHVESYDKFIVSIIAKKLAMGVTHSLIDLPVGEGTKVPLEDVEKVKGEFKALCSRFGMKLDIYERTSKGPDARGIGPVLEARDFLWILERHHKRPKGLENLTIDMAARLMVLAGEPSIESSVERLRQNLESGAGLRKFWQIAKAQGAKEEIKGEDLELALYKADFVSQKSGVIQRFHNHSIVRTTRALGAPHHKKAGIYLHKVAGDRVMPGEAIFTIYAETRGRLNLGQQVLEQVKEEIVQI